VADARRTPQRSLTRPKNTKEAPPPPPPVRAYRFPRWPRATARGRRTTTYDDCYDVARARRRHVRERGGKGGRLGHAVRERRAVVSPAASGRADRRQRRLRQDQLHGRSGHGEHDLRGTRDGRQGLLSGRQRRPAHEADARQTVRDHRCVRVINNTINIRSVLPARTVSFPKPDEPCLPQMSFD